MRVVTTRRLSLQAPTDGSWRLLVDGGLRFGEDTIDTCAFYHAPHAWREYADWTAELLRVLVIYIACVLRSNQQHRRVASVHHGGECRYRYARLHLDGGAHGGAPQINALEFVRLDAADGELDGVVDVKAHSAASRMSLATLTSAQAGA